MDLATTHLTADLDGLASMVALALLEAPMEIGLPGAMDPVSHAFWTDHAAELPPLIAPRDLASRLEREPLGRLRVGDTADAARIGFIGARAAGFESVLCWDNHPPQPGDLPRAPMAPCGAATSALVLELARRGRTPTPTEAALFLLGIHVDTGHFTFPNTTPIDHEAAARCLAWGAEADLPRRYLPKGFTASQLALLEQMAASVRHRLIGGRDVALLELELSAFEPDLSSLLEQLREAERWPTAFLLVAHGARVTVIGRSDGGVDVGAVTRTLGGGGHPEAASAVLQGVSLPDAAASLGEALQDHLERRRSALEVAVRKVVHVPALASVQQTAEILHQYRINSVPLSDGEGDELRLVGLVSRQEVDAAMHHKMGDRPVLEISAGPPAWIDAGASLAEARRLIMEDGRRLVAVGEPPGPALGVLTRGTLFRAWESDDLARGGPDGPPSPDRIVHQMRRGLGRLHGQIEQVGQVAAELSLPAYLVGGCVRDLLLGRPAKDVDIVIEGDATRVAAALVRRFGGRVVKHDAFNTARWETDQHALDLASARVEWYEAPAALPRVLHAEIRRDLYRRDFTVNAMAISISPESRGALLDPFGGLRDLRQGLLRVLHGLSFHDDPTRALRAARFAARFDFKLAPQTLGLLRSARRSGVLDALGRERLGAELDRILSELEVVQALRLVREWDLLALVHPRLTGAAPFLDRIASVAAATQRMRGLNPAAPPIRQADPLWMVISEAIPADERAALARLVPGDRGATRRWLEGPERVTRQLAAVWRVSAPSAAARALAPLDLVERTYALGSARSAAAEDWLLWWERTGQHTRTSVNGEALLATGARPGPALGDALRAAQDAAWDGLDAEGQLAAARAVLDERA